MLDKILKLHPGETAIVVSRTVPSSEHEMHKLRKEVALAGEDDVVQSARREMEVMGRYVRFIVWRAHSPYELRDQFVGRRGGVICDGSVGLFERAQVEGEASLYRLKVL